jgi:hypothetical protein
MSADFDQLYRELIDRLVAACREGQGQVAPKRVRSGHWNEHATADLLPDQHEINVLLARMAEVDRDVLARLLETTFVAGVHTALATLHQAEIPPFDTAYEGTPFHDFVGRLEGWKWPQSRSRS